MKDKAIDLATKPLKEILDTAKSYAQWFGKTKTALLGLSGHDRVIDSIKLEVEFKVETPSGTWESDIVLAENNGGGPSQYLILDWPTSQGLEKLFNAYKGIMLEAAKKVRSEAMQIYVDE